MTLQEIASVVGTPLLVDNATSKRLYSHYSCILVDMNYSRKLFHEITVEREGFAFNVVVAYEWLSDFCTHCQTIEYDVSACRWFYPRKETNTHKDKIVQGKKPVPTMKQNWVPIKDNPSGIGSSTAFARPQQDVVPVPTVMDPTIHNQAASVEPVQQKITVSPLKDAHKTLEWILIFQWKEISSNWKTLHRKYHLHRQPW